MTWLEVLVEGASDAPTLREVLTRKFHLIEGEHFRIHPHKCKGKLPDKPLSRPDPKHQGLLDRLPATLRGFGKSLRPDAVVLVVIDADDQPLQLLLQDLNRMLDALPEKPQVLFRIAVEETESWFIADMNALQKAFPVGLDKKVLKNIPADAVVGAWEKLALALHFNPKIITGPTKFEWAEKIAPYLDLENPKSPSFRKLIEGVASILKPIQT